MPRSPEEVLGDAQMIAVVGLSPDPDRPSHDVARYLAAVGFRILPVNPLAGDHLLGERCYASLLEIDEPVDLVDVFRRPEHCPEIAEQAVEIAAKGIWLQLGVRSGRARAIAEAAGLDFVEDACTAAVHRRMAARSS